MKKNFKYYIGIWSVLFVLFNVIAFISPGWITHDKYTSSFWIGYIFITLALLYAEAGMVSILASGAEPVAAVIFGLLFYAEIPTLLMLIGIAVTVFALTILCKQD